MQKTTRDTEGTVDDDLTFIHEKFLYGVCHSPYLAAKWSEIIASFAKCSAQDMEDFVLQRN